MALFNTNSLGGALVSLKHSLPAPIRNTDWAPGEISKYLTGVTSDTINKAMYGAASPAYASSGVLGAADVIKSQSSNQTPYNPQVDQWAQQKIAGLGGSGGGSGYQQVQAPNAQGMDIANIYESAAGDEELIRQQQLDLINNEFNNQLGYLGQLEGNVSNAYNTSRGNVENAYNTAADAINAQTATTKEGLGLEKQRAESESAKDLTRTRQRLADLNRRQAAYMSATGGYGSESTQAALAENFGRQAQQGLSDVSTRRDQALQDISLKMRQADDYATSKIAELATSKANQLSQLEQQKNSDLANIANNRNMAESAKAQAAFDTWRNYYDNRRSIELASAQWEQSLTMWRNQMATEAQDATNNLAYQFNPDAATTYNTQDTAMTGVVPEVQAPMAQGRSAPIPVSFSGENQDEYLKRLYGKLSPNQLAGYGLQSSGIASGVKNLLNQRALLS
jgi:hypothetical protein